jgi:transketolase
VIRAVDGHDVAAVSAAIAAAKQADKPTLICCKTIIGKGSPNLQGGDKVHGAALGEKEVAAVREYIGWPYAPFEIPADVYAAWDAKAAGAKAKPTGTPSSPPTAPSSRPKPLN